MFKSRYRMIIFLMPLFLVFYIAMTPLNPFIDKNQEIHPFYSWALFAEPRSWHVTENALVVYSIDGVPPEAGAQYLIPNTDIRDLKALGTVVRACVRNPDCDSVVEEILNPIVERLVGGDNAEFIIVKAGIDLRDVQKNIRELADGTAMIFEFYQPNKVIGCWSTSEGRVSPIDLCE